ncbi:PAS domain S-box protein [Leptospira broomii serovar Hurstbridge str. 5399]|uniref:histidine kinase n=1 Tax=Leptospira broomii serovar Hurstbridge str. 5399 TaxID=1049789 RepID=T0GJ49_9LEPT|nr:PAS domain S-box protein [Leptospira broomii]EQA45403.1 PAS domain S-box protein [Leptospira broomii serovar Hurstbridge str. 5399]
MDRELEIFYRAIFEQSPTGFILLNREGKIADVNEATLQILKATRADLIGVSFLSLKDKNMIAILEKSLSGKTQQYEGPYFTTVSKMTIQIALRAAPIFDYFNRINGVVLTFEDITKRKNTEKKLARNLSKRIEMQRALREKELKFRALFEAAGDAIFLMDERFFLECNRKTEEIFGCQKEDIIGHSPVDFSPEFQPDGTFSLEKAADKISLAFAGKPQTFEWLHCKKDRTNFDAEVTLNSVTVGGKRLLQAIVRDISERKKSEEQIRKLNEELEMKVLLRTEQLNASNNYLEHTNLNLRSALLELKSTQAQLVQSEKMAVLGQLIAGIAHEVNTPLGAIISSNEGIQSVFREGWESFLAEYSRFDEIEKKLWRNLFSKGSILPEFYDSIEERRKRKAIRDRLKASGFSKTDSLSDNLAELGIHLEDLPEIIKDVPKERFHFVVANAVHLSGIFRQSNVIREAAHKASQVIRALKTYVYQDHAGASEVNVPEQLDLVLTLYYNKLKHGVEIVRKFSEPSLAYGQADQLTQVWANLINNAFQAISYKGRLEIETQKEGNYLNVLITDNGPGIPPEIQDKIFEPFFTTKAKGEGSGLGLDICRKIVESHKGKIEVESRVGKTTFKVILPSHPK